MKCNNINPQKYKKSFFRKIIDFFKIDDEMYMTDEEAEYVDKNFDKIKSYTDKEGKKKWYVGR